jgi:hypothetical protein
MANRNFLKQIKLHFNIMLKMKLGFSLFVTQLLCTYLSFGQGNTPKYSNEFLAIGVGARGLAMAGAQVAIANDVTSAYWNPAGLLSIQSQQQASFMHASYFAGIANYDYLAFAKRIDTSSVVSVSIIRFAVDDIPDTRFLFDANGAINYGNVQFFSAADYAFLISYARKMPILGGVNFGGNLKVIHRSVGDFASAWGFGFDLGAQKKFGDWQVGVSLRDITGTFNAWSHNPDQVSDIYNITGNVIPSSSVEITLPRMVMGAGRYFQFSEKIGLLGSLDLEWTFDGKRNTLIKSNVFSIDPRFGVEANYEQKIFMRLGMGQIQQIKNFDKTTYTSLQPNFGIGVNLGQVLLDYALTDIGDTAESPYSHVFSIRVHFDNLIEND